MKDEKALQLMADLGPGAKDAVESWVTLQWLIFITDYVFVAIFFGLGAYAAYRFFKKN